MQGLFRSNGGCGYVKKPEFLIKEYPYSPVFNPKAKLPVKKTLKVRVYRGDGWHLDFSQTHFDSYSPLDFYVRSSLCFEVKSYDMSEMDDFGGQTCLPVSELRPWIQTVHLFDRKGEKYKSVKLLVQFQFLYVMLLCETYM
ncbi:phosphoinositide phospholipase C [Ranunculus cassubicifolius]